MFNKIKAVKDIRDQAKKMQSMLADIMEVGESGGVHITIDGNQQIQHVELPEALLGDKAKLEKAIKDACNDGIKKIQRAMAKKMQDMGGLDALKNLGL